MSIKIQKNNLECLIQGYFFLEVIDKIRTDYYFDVLELKDFINTFKGILKTF